MAPERRYSREQRQEHLSRGQLTKRVAEYGWIADPISVDLGEDFLVSIYDDGVDSGLRFMVQLKSVTDLERMQLQAGGVSCPLKVSDLERWETLATPVFIVLWDVNREIGSWIGVADAVADLNSRNAEWRAQGTARVHMPQGNGTHDAGLARLRKLVAQYYYPVLARGRNLDVTLKFAFPKTPDAREAWAALQRHIAAGDAVEIDGEYIEQFTVSDWWIRLFGQPALPKQVSFGPRASSTSIPVRLDMVTKEGPRASIEYVDLRVVKSGTEQMTLSNDQQPIPLEFCFVLPKRDGRAKMALRLKRPGANVEDMRRALKFACALAEGGTLQAVFLPRKGGFKAPISAGSFGPPAPWFVKFVERLCLIQEKTGHSLALDPDVWVTEEDARTAGQVAEIVKNGRAKLRDVRVSFALARDGLTALLEEYRCGEPFRFTVDSKEYTFKLVGVEISMGPAKNRVSGWLEESVDELKAALAGLGPGSRLSVTFDKAEVLQEFPDWMPDRTSE